MIHHSVLMSSPKTEHSKKNKIKTSQLVLWTRNYLINPLLLKKRGGEADYGL